jgi:hypothetical protein
MRKVSIVILITLIITASGLLVYFEFIKPLNRIDLKEFSNVEKHRKLVDTSIDNLNHRLQKNIVDTERCNLKHEGEILRVRDGKGVMFLYYSLYGFNPKSHDCWFTLGEISNNLIPDSGINKLIITFVDDIRIDTLNKKNIARKTIAIDTVSMTPWHSTTIPDPYGYGTYKEPMYKPNYIPGIAN